MRRHHAGSGRRPVIGADWAAAHRPVVNAALTGVCEVRRSGYASSSFDPTTGKTIHVPHAPHATAPCSVEVLSAAERAAVTGDQQVTTVAYRVTIPVAAAPDLDVDDLVKVTTADDNVDPTLVGRVLKVLSFTRGTVAWERDLICVDELG